MIAAVYIFFLYDSGDNGGDRVDSIDGDMGDGPDNHTGNTFVSEHGLLLRIFWKNGFNSVPNASYGLIFLKIRATHILAPF